MLSNIGKKGRLAATVLSAALSVTLVSPASAIIPDGATGVQDFVSNGKATMIYGSGSDTTYPMHQQLAAIFNRAPGCTLQTPNSGDQIYNTECNPALSARTTGYANYDRDLVSDYYFMGSTGGARHVAGWNQGTTGYAQADYYRSSSGTSTPADGRTIAFARDALAAFTFDQVVIDSVATPTPGASITELSTDQVKAIWQGTTKCWASIDKTLSPIYNTPEWVPFTATANQTSGTPDQTAALDESEWLDAAAGAGYNEASDAYKACVPIAVYTVPQTSGTATYWNTGVLQGSSTSVKSEGFLSLVDPFTGALFTPEEVLERKIAENNATPIANRLEEAGINEDLVTNAIYFYSIGKYTTALGGLDNDGNPRLSGNSTNLTNFEDKLFAVTGAAPATADNIASLTGYPYARSLFYGYQYPNQATRNYLDPLNGFLCSTKTTTMKDPINSANVREQIENAILGAGFVPLPADEVGGGLDGESFCRFTDKNSTHGGGEDTSAPTAGFEINKSTAGATAKKPVFTVTFNELVSGVSSSTVGIQEYSGTTAVGSPIDATLVCTNARQDVIPCLAATSEENYDLAPLQFVKKVTVKPNDNLAAGKTYKAFAKGTTGSGDSEAVAIQDRSGLSDWPIIDGNPLVTGTSAAHVIAKDAQTAPKAGTSVKKGKTISFSAKTAQGLTMTAKAADKKICTVAISKGNVVVKGVKKGTCKVTLTQAGNATFAALPSTVKTISVK